MRLLLAALATVALAVASACAGDGESVQSPSATPSATETLTAIMETVTPAPTETTLDRPVGIFVVDADGSDLHQVWDEDAVAHAWSPDGHFLAFAKRVAPTHDVMLLDLETGAVRNLGPTSPSAIKWSPDGRSLLLTAPGEGPDPTTSRFLETIDVTTGERKRLTAGIYGEWSPDGTRISFSGPSCERRGDRRIYDLETGEIVDLAPEYPEADVFISRDWSHIAYFKERRSASETAADTYKLYVADLNGSNEQALPTEPLGPGWPIWSPDGKWLSYTAMTPGLGPQGQRPYLLRSDGGRSPIALADKGGVGGWSPHSTMLVISGEQGITLYRLEDGERFAIWDTPAYAMEWSTDGTRLAFVAPTPDADRADLYVYDLGTQAVKKLSDAPLYAASPVWSPDGQRIAFLSILGGYDYGPCL